MAVPLPWVGAGRMFEKWRIFVGNEGVMFSAFMLLLVSCSPKDFVDEPPSTPLLGEQVLVTPGPGMPVEAESMPSNNNLDVVWHNDRVFYAFRTAPDHFASEQTRLHVVSSVDQVDWEHEVTVHRDTDVREPRFLSLGDKLFLYFAVLGTDPFAFEPQGTMVSVYEEGVWSEPVWMSDDNLIPWRTRMVDGVATRIGYVGGDEIYDLEGYPAIEVKWMTSPDGLNWTGHTVWTGGGSETDFAFEASGRLVAVVRNEAGDSEGFGSLICSAEPDSLLEWECRHDPRKYDSPLVFAHDGEIWLIGRRNVTETGHFDLGLDDLSHDTQFLNYSAEYWQTPKRCSLWRVDGDTLLVDHVLDLPSKGDTCFASILPVGEKSYEIYNYSSDPDGPDVSWFEGQRGNTNIYRQRLTFP